MLGTGAPAVYVLPRHMARPADKKRDAKASLMEKSFAGPKCAILGNRLMRPFRHVQTAIVRGENDQRFFVPRKGLSIVRWDRVRAA